jgi:Bacterial protein of unknown function (DUF839)
MTSKFRRKGEEDQDRLRRKVRLTIALLVVIGALAASAIYSFAGGGIKILKTDLGGGVTTTNPHSGTSSNILPNGFTLEEIARGTDPLENPSGVITKFGLLSTGVPTEPDENTYLILNHNPGGPTPGFDYGRRFLFQGHENAADLAYLTRINLDVDDPAHRITLLTPVGNDGLTHLNRIDGSVWNPFTKTLLFTQENGNAGGVIEIPADWGTPAGTLYGILGQGGYEGIHPDNRGNLYIAEDVGGTSVRGNPALPDDPGTNPKVARNPNSFIYRFVPNDVTDLSAGGKLQALQVSINGQNLVFVPVVGTGTGDVFSDNQLKLHTPGTSWPATWVTIHDTAVSTAAFDANAAAKSAGATPFKRPENLQFLPGSGFNTFFFDATGDTDARAGTFPALAARGAWGSLFRVDFPGGGDTGEISIFALGDQDHASFDNLAFVGTGVLLAAEDRGDLLHGQLNTLDSIWAYDVRKPGAEPERLVALGRDASAVTAGEDNEPTGVHYSDGASTVQSLLGKPVNPVKGRLFFTQQHGDNVVWEVLGSH